MGLTLKRFNIYLRSVLIFFYLLLFYVSINNYGYYEMGACLGAIVLLFLPNILAKFKIYFSDSATFIFFVFLFLGIIGETIAVHYFWYDKIVHFLSGFLYFTAGMVLLIIRSGESKVNYELDRSILYCFLFMIFILVSWEVFEAASDLTFGTNLLQTGFDDTAWDLVYNFLGGVLAAILFFWHFKRKQIKMFPFLVQGLFRKRL